MGLLMMKSSDRRERSLCFFELGAIHLQRSVLENMSGKHSPNKKAPLAGSCLIAMATAIALMPPNGEGDRH